MNRYGMLALLTATTLLGGCETAYYATMEQVGFPKREILVSRVESARDSQQDAREEITDALTAFGSIVAYEGGDLEAQYRKLAAQLDDSEAAAAAVHSRIRDVESVADALFDEWHAEARLEPALQPLRDQVLFLKHNLNARAIAGLKGEVARVDTQVNRLVAELNAAIAEADRFIADLGKDGG